MLFPIKRILVCTDLSEACEEVIRDAEILRQRVNGELDVLHVSDIDIQLSWASPSSSNETFFDVFVGNIARDLKESLERQIKKCNALASPLFAQGNVVETINQIIIEGEKKYDLLVIGHSSKKGILRHLMGSVARKIASSVPVPTLIVKKPMTFKKIAGLIDDTRPIDWMITSTLDFYRSLSFADIEFISLWPDLPEFLQDTGDTLKEDVQYFIREGEKPIIRTGATRDLHISDHLIRIMEEDHIDLAVMKRNRGKKLNKMIIGSETMRMLETHVVNILILPV